MRLNVVHLRSRRRAQCLKSTNLIRDQRVNFRPAYLHFSASKILAIVETGMRPDCHAFFLRHANGTENPGRIAGMKSTRNVGRANET